MSVEIEVKVDNTRIYVEELQIGIRRALEAVGIHIEGIATKMAPYDTGWLSEHITHAMDSPTSVIIGTNVPYGIYQEVGTSRYPGANGGRGYLRPAVEDNKGKIQQMFTAALKG